MIPTLAHISNYLLKAECKEPDVWFRQDYRIAGVMVGQVEDGERPSYEQAFMRLFGKHPGDVVGWWRNRRILARLAEACNTPTPLLLANQVSEVLAIIPDYDPTIRPARKEQREAA